jgi:predicted AAA+ superfamily ATPase
MIAAERESLYLDLEKPADRRRLESPMQMLEGRSGLVVLDEIQRLPKLFEILRVLADDPQTPARFLILGSRDAYFWATHQGAELDLLVFHRGRRLGFEVKFSDAPGITRSMRVAHDDLELDSLWVVHPGEVSWPMADGIEAVAIADLLKKCDEL